MTCVLLLCSQDRQLSSSRLSLADASNIQEMVQEMCLSQGNKEHSAEGEESESEGEGRVCTLYMYIERFLFDHEKTRSLHVQFFVPSANARKDKNKNTLVFLTKPFVCPVVKPVGTQLCWQITKACSPSKSKLIHDVKLICSKLIQ